jgi:uncharacterized membrane protein (UPF0182 family)
VTQPSDVLAYDARDAAPLSADDLAAAPVWDAFALDAFLERTARLGVHERLTDPTLQLLEGGDDAVPVFVFARELDLAAAADSGADLNWVSVHRGQFMTSNGAVVLSATRASPSGLPLFVPFWSQPDSAVEEVTDIALESNRWYFGPSVTDYAAVDREHEIVGVEPGGIFRRFALAWVLQSPGILRRANVSDSMVLVWERGVVGRLERYAPFLDFGAPYPVVVEGRLYWISTGYAVAEAFPGVPRVRWRGNVVGYVRASAVGIVDAATGHTDVYAFREPDLVAQGWLELAPSLLRPFDDLPPSLAAVIRYPLALFRVQRQVVAEMLDGEDFVLGRDPETVTSEPTWWVGAAPEDDAVRVRRVAVDESGAPPVVTRVLIGSVRRGSPVFVTITVDSSVQLPGPSQLVRRFIRVRDPSADVHGSLRVALLDDGLVVMQSSYRAPSEEGAVPELRGITVGRGEVIGTGATLAEAIERVGAEVAAPPRSGSWDEVRRWFQRLDAARQSGDWRAFGEAYDALRGLFVVGDSATQG